MKTSKRTSDRADGSYTLRPGKTRRGRLFVWAKRLFVLGLGLFVALVVVHGVLARQATAGLEADLTAYRAAGEPILPSDFVGPAVPDDQNVAVALRALAGRVDRESEAYRLMEWTGAVGAKPPYTAAERAALGRVAAENRAVLADLPAALARPAVDWGMSTESPILLKTDLAYLTPVRALATVVAAAAVTAHEAGDDAAALRMLARVQAIGRAVDRQPMMIPHLVSLGISALAAETATNLAPSLRVSDADAQGDTPAATATAAGSPESDVTGPPAPRPASRAQAAALIAALLDEADLRAGGRRALRGERMMGVDAARSIGDGRLALDGVVAPDDRQRWAAAAAGYTLRPMAYDSARLIAAHVSAGVAALDAPDWPTCQSRLLPKPAWENYVFKLRHLAAAILLPSVDAICRQDYHEIADRRMAAVAVAVRLYALDHGGRLPPALGDLVPRYMAAVPTDPLTVGRPLGYRPGGERPMVYSVGENGRDDGGTEVTPEMSTKQFRAVGDDVRLLRDVPRTAEPGGENGGGGGEGGAADEGVPPPEPAGPEAPVTAEGSR